MLEVKLEKYKSQMGRAVIRDCHILKQFFGENDA